MRVAERVRQIRRRMSDAEAIRERAEVLAAALTSINAGLGFDETLRTVVHSAIDLTNATYGVLGVRGHGHELPVLLFEGGSGDAREKILPLLSAGVTSELIDPPDPAATETPIAPELVTARSARVPIRSGHVGLGVLYVTEKADGSSFDSDDVALLRALAAAAGVAIGSARLAERVRGRQAMIEVTRDVGAELLSGADAASVVRLITSRALALVAADTSFLAVPDRPEFPSTDIVVVAASGDDSERLEHMPLVIRGTSFADAYRERTPTRYDRFDARNAVLVDHTGPALVLPLRSGGSVGGLLVTLRGRGSRPFTDDEFDTMTKFADQAALALQTSTAQRSMRELDVLTDRDRIARDLHDHAIQLIFAAGLSLQGSMARSGSAEVRERLTSAIDELQDVVQDIRSTIFGLRLGVAGPARLRERLDLAIASLKSTSPIKATLHVTGPLSVVGSALADDAEQVVREAVRNAVRHSWATSISVDVTVDESLTIEVTDNGGGMPTALTRSGLDDLDDRARAAGGTFSVQSVPGGGVHLFWSAPLS